MFQKIERLLCGMPNLNTYFKKIYEGMEPFKIDSLYYECVTRLILAKPDQKYLNNNLSNNYQHMK